MAIKGLTDRNLAFPEIGQIRKGAPKSPDRPGADLKYFRVEFSPEEIESRNIFISKYGMEPTELNIILPFNEIDRQWDAWLEGYTAGRMVARSDGEKFIYLIDTQTGETIVKNGVNVKTHDIVPYIDGQEVGKDYKGNPVYCKPVGRLRLIIPELARAAYLTLITTSIHDISNISAQLEAFSQLNNGVIKGIPFVLRRRPKEISTPRGTQRVRMKRWMLSIEADPNWVRAKLMEIKYLALPGNGLELVTPTIPNHESESGEVEKVEGVFVEEEEDDETHLPSNPIIPEVETSDLGIPEPPEPPDDFPVPEPQIDEDGSVGTEFIPTRNPKVKPTKNNYNVKTAGLVKTKEGVYYKDLPTEELETIFLGTSGILENRKDISKDAKFELENKRDASAVVYISRFEE